MGTLYLALPSWLGAVAAGLVAGIAATAFATPLLEWGRENVPPELAPRIARKLAERLGATYVKLGQFVASSPTLFPAEFVREFETIHIRHLDVCDDQIRRVLLRLMKSIFTIYGCINCVSTISQLQ